MDDKKQIKEMEELLSEYYENIDDSFASADIAMEIVDRVFYFVKRVQELEEKLNAQIESNRKLDKINRKWMRENKRHRKKIEVALDMSKKGSKDDIKVSNMQYVLNEALEELE